MAELLVRDVSKRYGSVRALDGVSLRFVSGEIHAVLGENGAGKSTLVSVASGFTSPDSGAVSLDGRDVPLGRAHECKRLGIEMIHQHFTLVPAFSVAENLALAALDDLRGFADPLKLAQSALQAGKAIGWNLDPDARTRDLPVGVQQRIEILKAIAGKASVLIFDEPTAVLSPEEVQELFRVLRRLRDEGKIVILIAHKLSEVLSVADRISVLRRGRLIATADRADVDAEMLANWMVGEMPPKSSPPSDREVLPGLVVRNLEVRGDRGEAAVSGVSFDAGRGEILGIGGVDGNGQVELAEALAQVRRFFAGSLEWEGKALPQRGFAIGYVPQDRQRDGLALGMTIFDNLLIGGLDRDELFRGPFIRMRSASSWVASLIDQFSIKVGNPNDLSRSLSGGNQQKIVVGRTLDREPQLLIFVNPTRGLDIKATQYVHDQILAARDRGAAIVLFSTDLDELYALSNRTLFLSGGRLFEDLGAASLVGGTS